MEHRPMEATMKYIGIDPGNKSAVALMEDNHIVGVHSINVSPAKHKAHKLRSYFNFIFTLFCTFRPEIIYYEEPYIPRVQAAKSINKKLGIIELAGEIVKIATHPLNPSTVKKVVTGNGRAEKDELADKLLTIVDNPDVIQDLIDNNKWDETDAVAIAICGYRSSCKYRHD